MKHFLRIQWVSSESFNYIITLRLCRPGKPICSEPIVIQWCDRCVLKSASLCGLCFSSWSPAELSFPPAEMKINHSGKTYVLHASPVIGLIEPQSLSLFVYLCTVICYFVVQVPWSRTKCNEMMCVVSTQMMHLLKVIMLETLETRHNYRNVS